MKNLFAFLLLVCISCQKTSMDVVDVGLKINVVNSENSDLLNPSNSNSISLNEIEFEYSSSLGQKAKSGTFAVNNPTIYQNGTSYILEIWPSILQFDPIPAESWVKIYWPDGNIDKINFEVISSGSITTVSKVYLNDNLKWPSQNTPNSTDPRIISILK